MAHQVEVLATNLESLSSNPQDPHGARRASDPPDSSLSSIRALLHVHTLR